MCEEASGLDGGLGWDWTAKRTSIWTARRLGRSAGLKCLKDRRGVVCVRRLRGRGSSPRVCCPALRCPRWRASTGRRAGRFTIGDDAFDSEAILPSCEASQPPFAPLVVEGPLEERHVPTVKLEIAIGDVVVRTDAAIDGEQLSRVIRAVRASR